MKIKDFLYLQKSDRQVLIVLMTIVVAACTVFFFVGNKYKSTALLTADSLREDTARSGDPELPTSSDNVSSRTPADLFPFDPNTADSAQLARLGLSSWQIRNIYKYRLKGGVYRQPSDFAQLYGLTVRQYRTLEPYIRISSDYLPASTLFPSKGSHAFQDDTRSSDSRQKQSVSQRDSLSYSPKLRPGETIILNQADTTELKRVPGIGSYYARSIIRYGQRLGGYHHVEQLKEISGFPEEAIPYFIIANPVVRRMNVNQLSLEQLRRHPYLNFYQARAIIDYRRLHGVLQSLDDLKLLKEFPPAAIQRLKPYVEY